MGAGVNPVAMKAKFNVNREKALFGEPDHPDLCERIAAGIPEEILRHGRILDCSIGCGGIARAVVNRMVNTLYIDHYDAILRVYGVDTNRALVNRARRLGFVNTVCADFLEWNPQMKFDAIVGNPPYQGGDFGQKVYKSLWPKFWAKSFELAKDDGIVSLITPLTWCSPTSDLAKCDAIEGETRLWNVFQKFTSVADVSSIKDFFPGVGSTFSLVTVDKSGNAGLSFTNGYQPELGFYPLSGADVVTKELSLTENISSNFSWKDDGSAWRVSIVKSRKVCEINVEVCERGQNPVSNLPLSLYAYVYCPTREQAEYVRERILACREILYKHCRYNGFIDLRITGMISIDKKEIKK